jgi:hypothetical protein
MLMTGSWLVAGDAVPPQPVFPPPLGPGDAIPPPNVFPPPVVVPPPVDDPAANPFAVVPEALILGNGLAEVEEVGDLVEPPPIAAPHSPAKPSALILRWDRYRTLVAIDTSAGLLKPCWVVTLSTMPEQIPTPRGPITLARGQVVVSYRAQAYYDKDGVLHIDARHARLGGIMAGNWSPDSFAITPAKEVSSRDDDPTHPSNSGEVEKEVSAETQREEYRRLMFTAQALVEGNI